MEITAVRSALELDQADLPELLRRFYDRVRSDAELGPVFNDAVHDWAEHLDRLEDFWSSVMLASGRYKGNPVVIHLIHADRITPGMFSRWLELWEQATTELLPDEVARTAQAKARRIAKSLQVAIRLRTPGETSLTNFTTKGDQ
ncbi:group III truncated hemoglobin (plasmid) [Microvirga terrae]|uniref:Group III truncated hemoglobin n=1 Tax=Microvirga terrae TaxID=2740529 RepID=A0ABY5RZS4_9HYPH|nr:group III truncated hemoglobin [Microvirga terrae]UVF22735.1 group III truncated hemoglobin [Microvirga terrae]